MNKTRIKITGSTLSPQQLKVRCERVYKLRTARKIGDEETVNNTVLGKLKANSLDIQFEKMNDNYFNAPGKLPLSAFRKKFSFNIGKGLCDFRVDDLTKGDYYKIDFDVYLPTKDMNLQREFVWTVEQKQELIISILKGIKLAPVSFIRHRYSNGSTTIQVIDGKQRVSTLISYWKGEFSFPFNGKNYFIDDLTQQAKFEIDQCLTADVGYEYHDLLIPDEEKIAWFEMINFAGTPQDAEHIKKLKQIKV